MSRVESRLPNIFYDTIDKVEIHLWMKFIRLLGLTESDIKSVYIRKNDEPQEKKYQCLLRWKMTLGNIGEADIENILHLTLTELDEGHPCPHNYPQSTRDGIEFTRRIYKFIESIGEDLWKKTVRTRMISNELELNRLNQANSDDIMECRYQIVLRYQRIQKLGNQSLLDYLNHLSETLTRDRSLPYH